MIRIALSIFLACFALSACNNDSSKPSDRNSTRCYATIELPLKGQSLPIVVSDTPDPSIPAGFSLHTGKKSLTYSNHNLRVLDDHADCARIYDFFNPSELRPLEQSTYQYGYFYLQVYPDSIPGAEQASIGEKYDAGTLTNNFLFTGIDPDSTNAFAENLAPTRILQGLIGSKDDVTLLCDNHFQVSPTSMTPYMIELIPPPEGSRCQASAQISINRDDPTSLIPPVVSDGVIPISFTATVERLANDKSGNTQWQLTIDDITISTE